VTTQKKYGMHAAAIYRERLKKSVETDTKLPQFNEGDLPDYETGRLQ